MEDTIFMKIVRKEVPAVIVYEDEETLAFLDNAPNVLGHTLVIPKRPFRNIFDVDEATLASVMYTVRRIAPAVRDAVDAKGVHIYSNHEAAGGQEVFHLHFHIIPRRARSEFEFCWPKISCTPAMQEEVAQHIRARLTV